MIKQTLLVGVVGVTLLSHVSALIDVSPTAVQYNLKTGVAVPVSVKASTTIRATTNADDTTVNEDIGMEVTPTRGGVTIGTSMVQGGTLPMSVSSTEELNAYTAAIVKTEASISAVDAESSTKAISVTWRNKGRFLGVIPVHVASKTTVEAVDSKTLAIRTTLPWWSFFVTDVANTATVTDASLRNSDEIKTNMKVDTSAQAKAHVIHAIVAHVSAIAEVKASAEAETK